MVADVGDRAELAVMNEDRDAVPLDLGGERRLRPELGLGAQPVPGGHVPSSV